VDTLHQIWSWSDHPLPRYETFTSDTLCYIVTLTIDLLTLNGSRNFSSCDLTLHQIWASYDHPFLSYYVHDCYWQYKIANWQLRMFSNTCPVCKGLILASVIHKNNARPMLKSEKLTARASYRVTSRYRVKNNYIFGIRNPNLAIHCDTFTGLR